MLDLAETIERPTVADLVFERLYEDINSLKLLPGAKLSETVIANRFGVSRQPVRDAFSRLESKNLLMIRPQRNTEVRGFSLKRITQTRFVRLSVELEVLRRACLVWDRARAVSLEKNLRKQLESVDARRPEHFMELDYEFHGLICELGGCPDAFVTIEACKREVDRLCRLSFDKQDGFEHIHEDHCRIADALKERSAENTEQALRRHLDHLDKTIAEVQEAHSEYFESQ